MAVLTPCSAMVVRDRVLLVLLLAAWASSLQAAVQPPSNVTDPEEVVWWTAPGTEVAEGNVSSSEDDRVEGGEAGGLTVDVTI